MKLFFTMGLAAALVFNNVHAQESGAAARAKAESDVAWAAKDLAKMKIMQGMVAEKLAQEQAAAARSTDGLVEASVQQLMEKELELAQSLPRIQGLLDVKIAALAKLTPRADAPRPAQTDAERATESDAALAMLQRAVDAMEGRMWMARKTMVSLDKDGNIYPPDKTAKQPAQWGASTKMSGLVSGKNLDMTAPDYSDERHITMWRWIRFDGRTWSNKSGDAAWSEDDGAHIGFETPPELAAGAFKNLQITGTVRHDGGTWLLIRVMSGIQDTRGTSAFGYSLYWLQLGKSGAPVAVRRYAFMRAGGSGERMVRGVNQNVNYVGEEFSPADVAAQIKPPAMPQGGSGQ